jgi:hypothetical protein
MKIIGDSLRETATDDRSIATPPVDLAQTKELENTMDLTDLAAAYHFEPPTLEESTFRGVRELRSSLSDY